MQPQPFKSLVIYKAVKSRSCESPGLKNLSVREERENHHLLLLSFPSCSVLGIIPKPFGVAFRRL